MKKCAFDLSFGNSACVRKAFMDTVATGYAFTYNSMMEMDYPVHTGDPDLIEITKNVIKRQIGLDYSRIFITNGATGADVIAIRAYAQKGYKICRTREAPYYSRFPNMIEAAGMYHLPKNSKYYSKSITLVDLPSNPSGNFKIEIPLSGPVILDAVYYNKVYCKNLPPNTPDHDVLTGSYSKLLGINGIRLGWIATNDDLLADRIEKLIVSEYCGLSVPSMSMVKTFLTNFNWENFESRSNVYLDFNREEISKLEKFFGEAPIPSIGMFYYAPMDKACQKLMEKAGIVWTKGSTMGTTDDFGRLNVGQDVNLIKEAVKTILKIDGI